MNLHIHFKKNLGQNFLNSNILLNLISKEIISLSNTSQHPIIEFGTGLGNLTQFLSQSQFQVTTIEKDRNLLPKTLFNLKSNMLNKQVKIYESNILNFFEDYFSKKISNKIIICGNIPYNLSSYILSNLVKFQAFIPAAIFLLPKEITDILLFTPSKKIYKTITSKYTVIPLLKIHNQAFFPKPKVTSILVKFISK